MRTWIAAAAVLVLPACATMIARPAQAQLMDSLKGAAGLGSSSGSSLGGLGGMAAPSLGSASSGNIAGVLGYCVRNNYVDGNGASSVQSGLMQKLGPKAVQGSQYESGSQGVLQTGNGRNVSLGGGGLKQQLTRKVCDQVLKHARSLL